ncbi:hypothetical protein BCR35DRAFT_325824 [Leucosporidium creatinivorum]|uniref:JmjC domain-containing protein n=1 Tax=Leucosporidium creatinivorum TaxID=106004 RepID=A0A1Y2EUT7_9BASI|nr:hypothetical protein BCR35DRAFT_325824 [Leucosporidium creatinivorum]
MSSLGAESVDSRGIPLLDPAQCTYSFFRQHHLLPNAPVLLPPSLIADWPVCHWRSVEDSSQTPSLPLTAFRDVKLEESGACLPLPGAEEEDGTFDTVGDLLDAWQQGRAKKVYLKDWHLPLWLAKRGEGEESVSKELYEVPTLWRDDWMNGYYGAETDDDFRFVYAGGSETFTPLHRDVYCSYSISTNLFGAKLWHLFPPNCTPHLLPLIAQAEREGRSVDVRDWDESRRLKMEKMGMRVVRQEQGESIFIPSGYYHQVTNLSQPTLSLNHNWCNSHNLTAMYSSMCDEVARCREAIEDVKELLMRKARQEGEAAADWRVEWEECVAELVKQSAGWNWSTFWRMVRHALKALVSPSPTSSSIRWPSVPTSARPSPQFVAAQVRPALSNFLNRTEEEHKVTAGLEEVLEDIERLLVQLEAE